MNKQNISAESKYEGKAKRPVAFTRLLTMLGPVMSRKFDPSVAYCKLRKTDMALENTFIYKKPGTFEMTNHVSLFQKLKIKYPRSVLPVLLKHALPNRSRNQNVLYVPFGGDQF